MDLKKLSMWLWSRSQERFWCQLTYNSSCYLNWLLADFRVVAGIRIVTPMLHIHKLRTKGRYWINLWCLCQCHSHQLNLINDSVSPVLSYVTLFIILSNTFHYVLGKEKLLLMATFRHLLQYIGVGDTCVPGGDWSEWFRGLCGPI